MAPPAAKKTQRVPMVGEPVIYYPAGKRSEKSGKPAVITMLGYTEEPRVSLETTTEFRETRDGVFHASVLDAPGAVTPEQLRVCGLWCWLEEHRLLHDAEVLRQEQMRVNEQALKEQQLKEQATKQEAVLLLREGHTMDEVSKATGIPKRRLTELVGEVIA